MKQILQNLGTGGTTVETVPAPLPTNGHVLIASTTTVVSSGTERMLVEFGRASLISKARQQPDKVRQVIDKARTNGIAATIEGVRSKLDQPLPLGYCNVGVVLEAGTGVNDLTAGMRVVSNGKHAEVVNVPRLLCARIPDSVTDETAAFTVLASIGLQGIRLAAPTIGECVVVTGLGLIGLLTVQMLRAHGCRVMGVDFDPERLAIANALGAEVVQSPIDEQSLLSSALEFSRGRGVDAVLITTATTSNAPISQAARMSRKRGRIILVGTSGLEISRTEFYEKELTFQVSCSYGPGRYDPEYESRGHDYPNGFVRWTQQRNFEAVLDLMSKGAIDVTRLVSHRYSIDDAWKAYELLTSRTPSLGIVIDYPGARMEDLTLRRIELADSPRSQSGVAVSFLGAGNYASRVLIPAFSRADVQLRMIASAEGVSARHFGKKFGFGACTTDPQELLHDVTTDIVVIATRHNAHARQIVTALEAGKHVFCEKPLCITAADLSDIARCVSQHPQSRLMIGFNRRFAPLVRDAKRLLATVTEPKHITVTVNAGHIPHSHWTQDPAVGGGRLIGEGCHFVDLIGFLVGSRAVDWEVMALDDRATGMSLTDSFTLVISYECGSVGVVTYLANGHTSVPKERIEINCLGRTIQIDNYLVLRSLGWPSGRNRRLWRQDKGQNECVNSFVTAVRAGGATPISFDELEEVARITIAADAKLRGVATGMYAD